MDKEMLTRKDALLKLIMELGGEGTRQEINEKIKPSQCWELREDDEKIEDSTQKPYYWHRADGVRQGLKDKDGFLTLDENIWKITQEGIEYLKKEGLYEEKIIKRLSKDEGKIRQFAVMKLLYENRNKTCNKGLIHELFPKYYRVTDDEYEDDAEGNPKYYKTVAGVLSYLKTQNKADNPKHGKWELTNEGIKELNPPLDEKEFYEPFKQWMNDNLKCEKVVICADNRKGGKYVNPDLIGEKDNETISIEIKSKYDLFVGILQSLCYKLNCHKSYLVIPQTADELVKIEALAKRNGIGLILFDNTSSENPQFKICLEARKDEPEVYEA